MRRDSRTGHLSDAAIVDACEGSFCHRDVTEHLGLESTRENIAAVRQRVHCCREKGFLPKTFDDPPVDLSRCQHCGEPVPITDKGQAS